MTYRICCTCLREGHLAHDCPRGADLRAAAKTQQPQPPKPAANVCPACGHALSNIEGIRLCLQLECLGST